MLVPSFGPLRTDLHQLAHSISEALPQYPDRPKWVVCVGNTARGEVEMTDDTRRLLFSYAPGTDPTDSSTAVIQVSITHPTQNGLVADRTDLTGRLLTDPAAAAEHIARTVLVAHDVLAYPQTFEGSAQLRLRSVVGILRMHTSVPLECDGWTMLARLSNGARIVARTEANHAHVSIALERASLPAAEAALTALLGRRISPPRPHGRLPEALRATGPAARHLAIRFPLEPDMWDTRHNRGDDRLYTTNLLHTGMPVVDVAVPAGAPGRSSTRVAVDVTCGVDTAALAIRAFCSVA